MSEILQGKVKRVVAQKEGWICFILNCELFLEVTVTSTLNVVVAPEQEIRVYGKFIEHKKWGQQFSAARIDLLSFQTRNAAADFLKFLFSSLPEDIIEKLTSEFSIKAFDAFKDLRAITFLSKDQKNYINSRLVVYQEEKQALTFLFNLDLSPILCGKAVAAFGSGLIQKIKENPYCLLDIEDFPFKECDRVAKHFGVNSKDLSRSNAVIFYILNNVTPLRGHLFLTMSELFDEIAIFNSSFEPIDLEKEAVFKSLKDLRDTNKIIVESKRLYAKRWFEYEQKSADLLSNFVGKANVKMDVEKFIREYEVRFNVQFSEEQEQAVKALTRSKVFIITGYPGTGKTFVTKVLVDVFKRENWSFALLTPTGISAKKLSLITGEEAGTIHRKLGYTGKMQSWKFNQQQKFAVDAVIIDEASMVDQEVFFRFLEAIPSTAVLIFIGDTAQLPSVAPGNVLRDLINSGCFEVVSFTKIFRQSEGSSIKINAKRIHEGKMVDVTEKSHFYFIQETEHQKILNTILALSRKLRGRDVQILSPKKASLIGTYSLNRHLKEVLNPPIDEENQVKKDETTLSSGLALRIDDKIMVTQNDYDREIFNGDCGKVTRIDHAAKEINFVIEGSSLVYTYSFDEARERLQLAFAITIHKSQGLEYDVVIFPYTLSFYNQLHRNLLYTAVTRASKRVFIIGDVKAIQKAINTNKIIKRNTFLAERIREFCSKKEIHLS